MNCYETKDLIFNLEYYEGITDNKNIKKSIQRTTYT